MTEKNLWTMINVNKQKFIYVSYAIFIIFFVVKKYYWFCFFFRNIFQLVHFNSKLVVALAPKINTYMIFNLMVVLYKTDI